MRRKAFRTKYPDAACVATVSECLVALQARPFDLVCLDHDLGNGTTGMPVVHWIVETKPTIPHLVIHSTNLVAGLTMERLLREAGYGVIYLPFTYDPGGPFHL